MQMRETGSGRRGKVANLALAEPGFLSFEASRRSREGLSSGQILKASVSQDNGGGRTLFLIVMLHAKLVEG